MKMTKRILTLFLGILIIVISSYLYLIGNFFWYYPAPIGVWILFDYLSYKRGNKTTFDLIIKKDYGKLLKLYIFLLILGYLIELIGMVALNLWSYKIINYEQTFFSITKIIIEKPLYTIGFFIYPFILASFRESYEFVKSFLKNKIASTIATMLAGIIIWEVPNTFSKDWIYTIPFIKLEIFNINILVIIGWSILIWAPILIYKYLDIK